MNKVFLQFGIDTLTPSVNVTDWNERMELLSETRGFTAQMRAYIESSGLIVKVLGSCRKLSQRENEIAEQW